MHDIERLEPSVRSGIRAEIYRALAQFATGGRHGPIPVDKVFLMAADGLVEKGIISRPEFLGGQGLGGQRFIQHAGKRSRVFPDYGIPSAMANLMRQTIWELYRQGVLAPAAVKNPQVDYASPPEHKDYWLHLDYLMLTPYGVQVLTDSKNRIQVHDPERYLANFWNAKPEPDYEMMLYLAECVEVFRNGHLFASVVLLGIASERLIEVLAAKLHDASGGTWYNNTYKQCRDISARFEAVENKLESAYGNELKSEGLLKRFKTTVKLAFNEIREVRNDIAHIKGRNLTWNEVNGLLHHFVPYFHHTNKIIAFLDAHSSK